MPEPEGYEESGPSAGSTGGSVGFGSVGPLVTEVDSTVVDGFKNDLHLVNTGTWIPMMFTREHQIMDTSVATIWGGGGGGMDVTKRSFEFDYWDQHMQYYLFRAIREKLYNKRLGVINNSHDIYNDYHKLSAAHVDVLQACWILYLYEASLLKTSALAKACQSGDLPWYGVSDLWYQGANA